MKSLARALALLCFALTACGVDPCPNQKLCGNSFCIPYTAECCDDSTSTYCQEGNYCSGSSTCTPDGYVACLDTQLMPTGTACPASQGCASSGRACN